MATFFAAFLGSVLGTALVLVVALVVLFWLDDWARPKRPAPDDYTWLQQLDGRGN